jgi:hypothetical protein
MKRKSFYSTLVFPNARRNPSCQRILEFLAYLVAKSNNMTLSYYEMHFIPQNVVLVECNNILEHVSSDMFTTRYTLPLGQVKVSFLNFLIHVNYVEDRDHRDQSKLILTCDVSMELLEEFVHLCYLFEPKRCTTLTKLIYWGDSDHEWKYHSDIPKRDLKTLFLPTRIKSSLKKEIKDFVTSKREYEQFGIPYHRYYLFQGKSGTGKVSTVSALAAYLDWNLAFFTPSRTTSTSHLLKALSTLPSSTILLFEDVDIFFDKMNGESETRFPFSAFFHLSGTCPLVFFTVQNTKRLPDSFFPPGKIHRVVDFTYASRFQIRKMFKHFQQDKQVLKDLLSEIQKQKIHVTTSCLYKLLFEYRHSSLTSKQWMEKFQPSSEPGHHSHIYV